MSTNSKPENPKVIGVLAVLVVIVLGYLYFADPVFHPQPSSQPVTNQPAADAPPTIGGKMAELDGEFGADVAANYDHAVSVLAERYHVTAQTVGDQTEKAKELLHDKLIDVKLMDLMKGMALVDPGTQKQPYAQWITWYITAREQGKNESDAWDEVRQLARAVSPNR